MQKPEQFDDGWIRLGLNYCPVLLLLASLIVRPVSAANPVILILASNATGARIQEALDGLPPGGEVVLPAGIYESPSRCCCGIMT